MSCGPPNVAAARRASSTSLRRVRRARSAAGTSSPASSSRPRTVSVSCTPSTCPLTSRSGPPGTAATTRRSVRPVTGSAPNSTPPHAGWRNGCTRTAIGASPPERDHLVDGGEERLPPAHVEHRREQPGHRLRATVLDRRRRAHDERQPAGVGQRLPRVVEGRGVPAARRCRRPGRGVPAVVTANPGSTERPAARARASAAALAPADCRHGAPARRRGRPPTGDCVGAVAVARGRRGS